ncbi:hypothetical protein NKG94_11720 [Micromonospora sp. M12]
MTENSLDTAGRQAAAEAEGGERAAAGAPASADGSAASTVARPPSGIGGRPPDRRSVAGR